MMHEDSLRESAKLIIDRMVHNSKWAEGDKDKAFDISNKLGLKRQSKTCGACNLKVVNYLRTQVGYPIVHLEEPQYKKRLAICKECPKLSFGVTCDECFCFVNLKTRFKNQQCPDGKW